VAELDVTPEQLAELARLRRRKEELEAAGPVWRWESEARPEQLPPEGDWFVWMIVAGRGWGKTRTGAEWLAWRARTEAGATLGVIGRTTEQTRETCIEGESGLLRALGLSVTSKQYNRTTGEIRLRNGAVIYAYSAENPESLRGPNLTGAWCDELGAWNYEATWTEGLIPALRIAKPRVLVTTTPRRTPLLKDLLNRDDGSVVVTRGATFDNAANLSEAALAELRRRYDGTRLGRQELYGELLEDMPGALWSAENIERTRCELV
jgi:phage terminase large subunit-like protein